jgi:hypothetical protein
MFQDRLRHIWLLTVLLVAGMCRKPYNPPAIKASNHYLSVDGFINTGVNAISSFTLSRSRNLDDSGADMPELKAQVSIQGSNGNGYALIDSAGNGIYSSAPLNLDLTQNYQLTITTSDGNKYLSDFVTQKTSPPIDSVTWKLLKDPVTNAEVANIYVNSHDPANNTHYYRWDFLETWQHRSLYQTIWGVVNGLVYPLDSSQMVSNCWSSDHSNDILLGSSINLNQDVIAGAQLVSFMDNDPKMDVGYSILVRQYPLTLDAYNYWLTVQKNSQSLGGLFDLQPSQVNGNIHSITNPGDPVLGYVAASSVQEMRLFIDNDELGWKSNPVYSCPMPVIATDPSNVFIFNYPDTSFGLYHYISGPPPTMLITRKECLDCTYQGGTNVKPSYWP